jgi:K+/H+ antiporter YhaU regulatory subunit KhtT
MDIEFSDVKDYPTLYQEQVEIALKLGIKKQKWVIPEIIWPDNLALSHWKGYNKATMTSSKNIEKMNVLFNKAEELFREMKDILQQMMLCEVSENSFEMSMDVLKNENPFSQDIRVFMQNTVEVAKIMNFLDTKRSRNET